MHDALVQPSVEDGRIFLPLGDGGCGVGCRYCYIPAPARQVGAIPPSHLSAMLESLTSGATWQPGPDGPILAIGCDTELAMTEGVLAHALTCLDLAQEYHLPVQLATKFPLPTELRARLDAWPPTLPRVVVFTSITSVTLSRRLEPAAPSPQRRAGNFRRTSDGWLSYALIKPFLAFSKDDQDALFDLLAAAPRPDGVVVGIRYRRTGDQPGDPARPHPVAPGWTSVPLPSPARRFVDRLTELNLPVFLNTRCVSAYHNGTMHGMFIRKGSPELCVDCGACP